MTSKCIKLLAYSDIHWHDFANGITLDDISSVMHTITQTAIDERVDMIVFGGDEYTSRNPTVDAQTRAQSSLIHMSEQCASIPIIRLVGNHCRTTKNINSTYSTQYISLFSSTLENVTVMDTCHNYMFNINGTSISIDAIPAGHMDKFTPHIQDCDFNICLFHDLIKGSKFVNGTASQHGVPIDILDMPQYDIVLGGDNHHPQMLDMKNTAGIYIGAPIQHSWRDIDSERGFWIINLIKDNTGTKRELYFKPSNTPHFIKSTITITSLNDLPEYIKSESIRWNNNIVKLTLIGPSNIMTGLNTNNLKQKLSSAYNIRKLIINTEHLEQIKPSTQTIINKDDQEWINFVGAKKLELSGLDIDRIIRLGLDYIEGN